MRLIASTMMILAQTLPSFLFSQEEYVREDNKLMISSDKDKIWKEFISIHGQFSIKFPTQPTHKEELIEIREPSIVSFILHEYESSINQGEQFFGVYFANYPPAIDLTNPHEKLENSINAMIAGIPGSQLIEAKFEKFEDVYPCANFLIKDNDRGYLRGFLTLVGRSYYQVSYYYLKEKYNEQNYWTFVQSFTLRN